VETLARVNSGRGDRIFRRSSTRLAEPDAEVADWQSAIDIVLRRFTEYHDLESAFGRRAVTERAKGILMECHSVDDADAFEMLRDQSRRTKSKLADVAAAVVEGHQLLPKQPNIPS
jgi:ANTAR domain